MMKKIKSGKIGRYVDCSNERQIPGDSHRQDSGDEWPTVSSRIYTYNNLHSFSFIEPAKSSFSNNLQGSNCTVNAQIMTNPELAVQKKQFLCNIFFSMLLYKCTKFYEQTR